MSDPLSIAGTAVGIVSLGLTICSGLIEYVDGVKCRKDDIELTLRHINCLHDTFLNIESALSKLSRDHSVTTGAADKCLRLSEGSLHRLQLVLNELKKEALPSDNLNSKIVAQARKLSYPFRKANLRRLEVNVIDLNGTLQIILQAIELDVNGSQLDRLAQLVENSNTTSNQITTLLEGVTAANQSLTLQNLNLGLLDLHLRSISEAQRQQVLSMQSMDQEIKKLQMQLISKPDALRTVCCNMDELRVLDSTRHQGKLLRDWSPSISRPIKRSTMPCSCFGQYTSQNYHYATRKLSLSYNHEAFKQHLPDCQFCTPQKKSHKLKARFTYLGYILSASIQTSISITTGAGGFSISPSLSISRVVPNNACAFELLGEEGFAKVLKSSQETVARRYNLLEYTKERLLKMFNERRASPKDINERGESLIHVILRNFDVTQVEEPLLLHSFCKLLTSLSTCGVPVNTIDSNGFSPFFFCASKIDTTCGSESSRLAIITITETLIEGGSDCTIYPALWTESEADDFYGGSGLEHMLIFQRLIDLAEVFQCGPLSLAVLRRSEIEVRRILASQPQCFAERNLLRQTPLHLSYDWPLGVKLILEAGGHDIIDNLDVYGFPAFVYACEKGCIAVLDLLLAADCCLFPPDAADMVTFYGGNTYNFAYALRHGNVLTTKSLLSCLKVRRNCLKALAFEMLPVSNFHELLETNDIILDSKATDICAALKAKEIVIPLSLAIPINKDTIYHLPYLSSETAKMLYEFGFRDFDKVNAAGLTPLMSNTASNYSKNPQDMFSFSSWLLSQGASLGAKPELSEGSSHENKRTAAHFLAGKVGHLIAQGHFLGLCGNIDSILHSLPLEIYPIPGRNKCFCINMDSNLHSLPLEISLIPGRNKCFSINMDSNLHSLPIKVSLIPERDGCFCSCSTGGCCPATVMLKAFTMSRIAWVPRVSVITVVNWLAENVMAYDKDWDWLLKEILRYMTFDALEIRHTCCRIDFLGAFLSQKLPNPEDVIEIREEYAYLLDLLEVLMEEFEAKYVELGLRFVEFLGGYWAKRMREVIAELNSVDPEELQRITELGVVLEKAK